jgi:hypothetical protein
MNLMAAFRSRSMNRPAVNIDTDHRDLAGKNIA